MNDAASLSVLPAQRIDAAGRAHVNMGEILKLAAPLMATNAVQSLLNLTDLWFIGRLSTDAVAAMGAIYWILTCAVLLFGGVGLAVQTFVAQAFGSRRRAHASRALWNSLWATLALAPLFLALAFAGPWLLHPFGLDPHVEALALEYWTPRMGGAFIGSMGWAAMGFFNGIAAVRYTMLIVVVTTITNAVANQVFMFELGMGMKGSAWGTNFAQLVGVTLALALFLRGRIGREYRSTLMWRPQWSVVRAMLVVGMPIGVMYGADVLGLALSQMMIAQTGPAGAAATQIVMALTSMAYMPTIGIALAGTTLVGQSIGAGSRDWANRLGNRVIALCATLMAFIAVMLIVVGPWVLPLFVSSGGPEAADVVALGLVLLWPAAAYQVFDGLYCGAGFCLRGAGDTRVPAATALVLSWFFFVPLAHTLIFAPGQGWIDGLPQFGLGARGGWIALMTYVTLLGSAMFWRWRHGAWRRVTL
ncbi:MAG TPA: MATE family efflux transporter [Steroidobacteraceae bacterium]|jgi:MATE family multidrug resistance protein|nr:MATE family efflux transporter [Steroidobacteraceae bacterium]